MNWQRTFNDGNLNGGQEVSTSDTPTTEHFNVPYRNTLYLRDKAVATLTITGNTITYYNDKGVKIGEGTLPSTSAGDFLSNCFPIGIIVMSTSNNSPASQVGGVWERLEDVFPVFGGSTFAVGSTGGAVNHSHVYGIQYDTHFYDNSIRPETVKLYNGSTYGGTMTTIDSYSETYLYIGGPGGNGTRRNITQNTGTTSNLPPYRAVYAWRRTA